MARKSVDTDARRGGLSRERIVKAAIELLDAEGESGLTFRTLSTRLSTGAGAIYWHVANKDELLAAATEEIISGAMRSVSESAQPADVIRAVAAALFDAIDAHPWAGTSLSQAPWQSAMRQIFERMGVQLQALHVPEKALFFSTSTLVDYVLGVAAQSAANARNPAHGGDRAAFLAALATTWAELDPVEHPFARQMAKQLGEHDDQEQFLAGIDIILAGIAAVRVHRGQVQWRPA